MRYVLFFLILLGGLPARAQFSQEVADYIQAYRRLAMEEMLRTGVPAAITLAQGIHESGAGRSELARRSNNHFGIKCKSNWSGDRVYHDDDARGECFRSYPSALLSYKDHSDFLRENSRYSFLFSLDPEDYSGWASGLRKAGYATNPQYAQIITKLIEEYQLQQYTLMALGKVPVTEEILAGNSRTQEQEGSPSGPALNNAEEENIHDEELPELDYPEGVFKINDTRVVFLRKGASLLAVARAHDLPLARLLDFNDLADTDVLPFDQLLYVQRKRKRGAAEFHIAQRGETLYSICQSEGVRLESLMEYNGFSKEVKLAAGQKVFLQPPVSSAEGQSMNQK